MPPLTPATLTFCTQEAYAHKILSGALPSVGEGYCVPFYEGQTLAQAVFLSGLFVPPPLCAGLAHCGRCRVQLHPKYSALLPPKDEDSQVFTPVELREGWRLGCHHPAFDGLCLEVMAEPLATHPLVFQQSPTCVTAFPSSLTDGLSTDFTALQHAPDENFMAIDLGTTSLHWAVSNGQRRVTGSMVNPQMGAGSDVISRLALASRPEGQAQLTALTRSALCFLADAAAKQGLAPSAVCLAANPAMTAIALNVGTEGIARLATAPYSLPVQGGAWASIDSLAKVWVAPQLSPFVGGDIAAGYAALVYGACPPQFPFLLADMGTNGEFLLALAPDKALVASVALGPALEGISLSFGAEARPGVITRFGLSPYGLEPDFFSDQQGTAVSDGASALHSAASKISGTGYLSLVYRLLLAGALNREGHFIPGGGMLAKFLPSASAALEERAALGMVMPKEQVFPLPGGIYLSAGDVEELLKAKAAFSAGITRLLAMAELTWSELSGVYLAGALGEHMEPVVLEGLGFVPPGGAVKLHAAGNTSLQGAELLVQSESARAALVDWARTVQCVNFAEDTHFTEQYVRHMHFAYGAGAAPCSYL